jgi:hypothetical protein
MKKVPALLLFALIGLMAHAQSIDGTKLFNKRWILVQQALYNKPSDIYHAKEDGELVFLFSSNDGYVEEDGYKTGAKASYNTATRQMKIVPTEGGQGMIFHIEKVSDHALSMTMGEGDQKTIILLRNETLPFKTDLSKPLEVAGNFSFKADQLKALLVEAGYTIKKESKDGIDLENYMVGDRKRFAVGYKGNDVVGIYLNMGDSKASDIAYQVKGMEGFRDIVSYASSACGYSAYADKKVSFRFLGGSVWITNLKALKNDKVFLDITGGVVCD